MRPNDGVSILDLGGGYGDFLARVRAGGVRGRYVVAELANHYADSVRELGFNFVQLEEDKRLPFSDGEFDIVICNSVIEHVTLPKAMVMSKVPQDLWVSKSLESQKHFANEIRRIGKAYFVQTPHKNFPLETHTWLPLVNWLSHNHTASLVRFTDKYWVKGCGYADWNLLGTDEMKKMFPEADIHVERLIGIPKSIIAYHSAN